MTRTPIPLPGGAALADLAGFVLHFLDAIGVERVHAVGHSMGGAVAAQMALAAPQRVASLVLIASAGLGSEINRGYIEGFVAAATRRELKPVIEQLFADPGLVSRQLLDDLLKFKRLDGVSQALTQLGEVLFGGGRQAALPVTQLAGGKVPVTLVWGREDRIIPAAHAAQAPAAAKVQVLEGENAVAKNRELMGATNPKDAAPGTIRADFAQSIDANAVHGSDSTASAAREIAYFFAQTEIHSR